MCFGGEWQIIWCNIQFTFEEDVRSLALPGSYHEKITHLGRSLVGFTRLKHLDLSRNAIRSLEVTSTVFCKKWQYLLQGLENLHLLETLNLYPSLFSAKILLNGFLNYCICLLGTTIMYLTYKSSTDYGITLTWRWTDLKLFIVI